ncbi:MAG TPA: SPOR domain-containing protein [Candidatus Tectomicrobia bacterium]|nr:SPOR domain-containing protein [Candidatus Tectomicrobia bacterium]
MDAPEIARRLSAKGFSGEAAADGVVVVRPSLPLREAVTLSKGLAVDGLKVQVKRANRTAPASTPAQAATPAPAGETWYRVRIGPFPDRATAEDAVRDAEAKGYKAFIARGDR